MTRPTSTSSYKKRGGPVFIREKLAAFFDDAKSVEREPKGFLEHAMSDLLIYRSYEEEHGLYMNRNSYGFMMELRPGGSVEDLALSLEGAMSSSMGSDTTLQVLNWAGPDILGPLTAWSATRRGRGDFIARMAAARVDFLYAKRFGEPTPVPMVPMDRRIFILAWKNGEETETGISALKKFRSDIVNACGGPGWLRGVEPQQLLRLLAQICHCQAPEGLFDGHYSAADFINHQLPGCTLKVDSDSISLSGTPRLKAACATVTKYPPEWRVHMGFVLNGEPKSPQLRAPGPVLTSFTAKAIPQQVAKTHIAKKLGGVMHTAQGGMARFLPNLGKKQQDLEEVNEALESGGRLFETVYSVVGYAQEDHFETADPIGRIEQIYRGSGIHFTDDKYLQLPVFLGTLPFGLDQDYMQDFKRAMRMRLLQSDAVARLIPAHAEYSGTGRGNGLMLLGRQGQVFNWSNFDSSGNYNVSIVGKSGAGKSVFMQDLILSIYAENGKAVIIDDGRSFERICDMLGGTFIAFDSKEKIELNPFGLLDAAQMLDQGYPSDAIEMLTNLIGTMCSLSADYQVGRVDGFEEGYVSQIIDVLWEEKGAAASIDDVYTALEKVAKTEPRVSDMLVKLERFTTRGDYGEYFNFGANLSIDNDFVVFEMAELKTQKALQEVILQIIMFLGTEVMFKSPRGTKVAIVIDEAWDLLSGKTSATFVEGIVRRARKYTGALICGTQSVDDFLTNPSAKVVFENSDNFVCLQQKPETIERLTKESKIDVDGYVSENLKALKKVSGMFSECGIHTPEGWVFGRLALDPFSLAVFSTKGTTVQTMNSYVREGLSYPEAIERMIERGEVE